MNVHRGTTITELIETAAKVDQLKPIGVCECDLAGSCQRPASFLVRILGDGTAVATCHECMVAYADRYILDVLEDLEEASAETLAEYGRKAVQL